MSDYIPIGDKVQKEQEAGKRLLKKHPFLGALAVIGVVLWVLYPAYQFFHAAKELQRLERENSNLSSDLRTLKSDYARQQEIVSPVLLRAAKEFPGEEINASLKKLVERLDATRIGRQTLHSAQATIDLRISDPVGSGTHMFGASIGFGQGSEALLIMRSSSYSVRSLATNEFVLAAETRADANDLPQDKKGSFLSDADYIQLSFGRLPENCNVLGGRVTIILNGATALNFDIPRQRARGKIVFIGNVKPQMKQFLE